MAPPPRRLERDKTEDQGPRRAATGTRQTQAKAPTNNRFRLNERDITHRIGAGSRLNLFEGNGTSGQESKQNLNAAGDGAITAPPLSDLSRAHGEKLGNTLLP
jgi:hypothetical protein